MISTFKPQKSKMDQLIYHLKNEHYQIFSSLGQFYYRFTTLKSHFVIKMDFIQNHQSLRKYDSFEKKIKEIQNLRTLFQSA